MFIRVFAVPPASLRYATNPVVYSRNKTATPNIPRFFGNVSTFVSIPLLPAGLTINSTTGVISGFPTALQTTQVFLIVAQNTGGSTSTQLTITVTEQKPTSVVYSAISYQYNVTNNSIYIPGPNVTGVDGCTFSITPALPNGIVLDTITGSIQGTANGTFSTTIFTVTAATSGGTAAQSIQIYGNYIFNTSLVAVTQEDRITQIDDSIAVKISGTAVIGLTVVSLMVLLVFLLLRNSNIIKKQERELEFGDDEDDFDWMSVDNLTQMRKEALTTWEAQKPANSGEEEEEKSVGSENEGQNGGTTGRMSPMNIEDLVATKPSAKAISNADVALNAVALARAALGIKTVEEEAAEKAAEQTKKDKVKEKARKQYEQRIDPTEVHFDHRGMVIPRPVLQDVEDEAPASPQTPYRSPSNPAVSVPATTMPLLRSNSNSVLSVGSNKQQGAMRTPVMGTPLQSSSPLPSPPISRYNTLNNNALKPVAEERGPNSPSLSRSVTISELYQSPAGLSGPATASSFLPRTTTTKSAVVPPSPTSANGSLKAFPTTAGPQSALTLMQLSQANASANAQGVPKSDSNESLKKVASAYRSDEHEEKDASDMLARRAAKKRPMQMPKHLGSGSIYASASRTNLASSSTTNLLAGSSSLEANTIVGQYDGPAQIITEPPKPETPDIWEIQDSDDWTSRKPVDDLAEEFERFSRAPLTLPVLPTARVTAEEPTQTKQQKKRITQTPAPAAAVASSARKSSSHRVTPVPSRSRLSMSPSAVSIDPQSSAAPAQAQPTAQKAEAQVEDVAVEIAPPVKGSPSRGAPTVFEDLDLLDSSADGAVQSSSGSSGLEMPGFQLQFSTSGLELLDKASKK